MKNNQKAALLMIIGAFFYAAIAASVKWITDMPVFEKLFFRTTFSLFFILTFAFQHKIPLLGTNKRGLVSRGVTGFCGTILYYYALSNAAMAESLTLSNLYPFFVVIFSAIFLKELIKPFHIVALILSFIGTLFIVRPGFDEINIFYLIAILSSVFMGASYTLLKHIQKTDSSESVMFYFTAISMFGCLPFMLLQGFVLPSLFQWFQLAVLGLTATLYQWFMTTSYKYAPASEVSVYSYTSIIFSGGLGIVFFGEYPAISSIFGIIFILIGAYAIFKGGKDTSSMQSNAP